MQTLTRVEPCACETGAWRGPCSHVSVCQRNAAVEDEAEEWARLLDEARAEAFHHVGCAATLARCAKERDEARAERDGLRGELLEILTVAVPAVADAAIVGATITPTTTIMWCIRRLKAERDGARALAEQYQRQIAALEEAVRQANESDRESIEMFHRARDRAEALRASLDTEVQGSTKATALWLAAEKQAEANRRDAERWRAHQAGLAAARAMMGDPRVPVSSTAMKEPSRE